MPTAKVEAKKITIEVPADILEKARKKTGRGITETVRQGLRLIAASSAYEGLQGMRGKVKVSRSWQELKEDRS